jgi:hypothetical protein
MEISNRQLVLAILIILATAPAEAARRLTRRALVRDQSLTD